MRAAKGCGNPEESRLQGKGTGKSMWEMQHAGAVSWENTFLGKGWRISLCSLTSRVDTKTESDGKAIYGRKQSGRITRTELETACRGFDHSAGVVPVKEREEAGRGVE